MAENFKNLDDSEVVDSNEIEKIKVNSSQINDEIEGLEKNLLLNDKEDSNNEHDKENYDEDEKDNNPLNNSENQENSDNNKQKKKLSFSLESNNNSFLEKIINNKKLLFIILFLLLSILILFIFLATGNDEIKMPQNSTKKENIEQPRQETMVNKLPKIETYKFDIGHINVKRLNKKLETLTKYELLGITEEEYLKQQQLEKIKKEKQQKEEEIKRKQEEKRLAEQKIEELKKEKVALEMQKALEELKNNETKQKKNVHNSLDADTKQTDIALSKNNDSMVFIKFIQIDTRKNSVLKTYLSNISLVDKRVQACRDINNNIQIFVGPLDNRDNSNRIIELLKEKDSVSEIIEIELTTKEFEARCF